MTYDDGDTHVRALKADGQIGLVPLVGVLDSGVKPVMRLWLSDGRDVTLTHAHEVVTPEGKVRADSLLPGHSVLVDSWRGRPEHWGERRQRDRDTTRGTKLPDGRYMDKDGYILVWSTRRGPKKWMYEHRVVMEAMLGRELRSDEHVHHVNHHKTDNRPENLRVTTHSDHATHHADRTRMPGAVPQTVTVLRVEDAGQRNVYDLSVDDDAHTWIGNGVVVGNTGKTPMTIAALEELREEFGEDFCGIVVCGGGLKEQWVEQILVFTCTECRGRDLTDSDPEHQHVGSSSVINIDGTPEKRWKLYDRVAEEKPMYVVLGYAQVVDDNNRVRELPQMFVVADEITTIKTPGSDITEAFRETFNEAHFRYGLTGTPMENGRPEEMFQLMVWIDDSVLGRPDLFDQTFVRRNRYGKPEEYINLPLFYEMMRGCSTSIDPDDPAVRDYMPTMKKPLRVLVEFDEESARVYNLMRDALLADLADAAKKSRGSFDLFSYYSGGADSNESQGKIMAKISCMRMLCSHPDVLLNSAQDHLDSWKLREEMIAQGKEWPTVKKRKRDGTSYRVPKPLAGSAYAAELLVDGELDMLIETPKLDEVCSDIEKILAGRCTCEACEDVTSPELTNKIVLFSYHKMTLRILERRYPGISTRYDGDMSLKVRNASKKTFQRDPAVRLFLTSDAGGYGVDLPQGNHLLNADKPYTAGRVTQRNARVRRANLDFHLAVHARDYLISGSIEVFFANATTSKQKVVHAVRTGQGTDKGGLKVNAQTLGEFLNTNHV